MTEHSHVIGGSSAARRINCPGSLPREKAIPDGGTSEFAARGSMLHAAIELVLINDPQDFESAEPLFAEMIGQDLGFSTDEFELEITEELIDSKLEPALEAWFILQDKYGFVDWSLEQLVSIAARIKGGFGTADVLALDEKNRLHVIDWKFGDGVPVPAENNLGLGFYAGAAWEDDENDDAQDMLGEVDPNESLFLHICQPREGYKDFLFSWQTDWEWIETVISQAEASIKKGLELDLDAPLVPGDWCRWCKAQAVCPAQQNLAVDALSRTPESMSAVELAKCMAMASQLDAWVKAVNKLAYDEASAGVIIPGFKLVNKRPQRVWTDPEAAEKILRNARLGMDNIMPRSLISPAKAEKLNKRLYSSKLSDIVAMYSSGTTLVSDDDPRQAVVSATELLANALPKQKQ